MEAAAALQHSPRKITHLGIAGLAISLLALMAAALSPWAIDALEPETKPIDQVAAEVAGRIKDRIAAKAKGQEYIAHAEPQRTDRSKWYSGSVIAAGVLAVCIGVVGLVAKHDGRLNAATIAIGATAIVFQYALIIAAALLLILLVGLILSVLGGGA
jgi:hypothetical protein